MAVLSDDEPIALACKALNLTGRGVWTKCDKCGERVCYDRMLFDNIQAKWPGRRVIPLCMSCAAPIIEQEGRKGWEQSRLMGGMIPEVAPFIDDIEFDDLLSYARRHRKH